MYKNILSEDQLEARGKNAVANLLARRLIVPKIFFDAAWPAKRSQIDVLAVDRAGAGDIHVVEVKVGIHAASQSVAQLKELPAHYKYVAIVNPSNYRLKEPTLYSSDGLGRVGVILFEEGEHNQLVARIEIAPERFRVGAEIIRRIDRFTATQHADMEIRV
ncbi:MAG: hypothetical protein WCC87_01950 [Candidatus Korobacteraceae bacterium]